MKKDLRLRGGGHDVNSDFLSSLENTGDLLFLVYHHNNQ
jgi:hypothetical protein